MTLYFGPAALSICSHSAWASSMMADVIFFYTHFANLTSSRSLNRYSQPDQHRNQQSGSVSPYHGSIDYTLYHLVRPLQELQKQLLQLSPELFPDQMPTLRPIGRPAARKYAPLSHGKSIISPPRRPI